ncbi:uncharacterized protein LOC144118698 [Amblyomma americanum]
MLLLSSVLLILMLVVYLCVVAFWTRRGRRQEWPFWNQGASCTTATIVLGGHGSADATHSTLVVPAMTIESAVCGLDSDQISTAAGMHPEATTWEVNTPGGAQSMTETRGLGSSPDEPFVRPVLSRDEVYAMYPHLRGMSTLSAGSHREKAGGRRPTRNDASSDETKPDKAARSFTPDASGRSRRKHPFSTVAKRVVLPDGKDADKGPKAAYMEDSACAPRQDSWSMPWKSLGSSLDALLSIPVSGAVHSCSSTGTDIASELDGELFRPVRKL